MFAQFHTDAAISSETQEDDMEDIHIAIEDVNYHGMNDMDKKINFGDFEIHFDADGEDYLFQHNGKVIVIHALKENTRRTAFLRGATKPICSTERDVHSDILTSASYTHVPDPNSKRNSNKEYSYHDLDADGKWDKLAVYTDLSDTEQKLTLYEMENLTWVKKDEKAEKIE
jgi:hypothetical protein